MEKKDYLAGFWDKLGNVGMLMDTVGFQILFYFVAGWVLALIPYTGILYLFVMFIFIYRNAVRGGIAGWIGGLLPIVYMTLVGVEEKLVMWNLDIFDWRTFLVLPGETANAGINAFTLSKEVNFEWWNIILLFVLGCGCFVLGRIRRKKKPEKYAGLQTTFLVKRENWKLAGMVLLIFLILAAAAGFGISRHKERNQNEEALHYENSMFWCRGMAECVGK